MKKLSCILFIDDDEPTNYLNKMIVEEMRCTQHIQIVHSGREALDYLTRSGSFENREHHCLRPDLIFLDINMPGMDGWEFLDAYQQLPASQKANIVMVMLTTSLNLNDEKNAQQYVEISGFENKPLQKEMVEKIISQFFPELS